MLRRLLLPGALSVCLGLASFAQAQEPPRRLDLPGPSVSVNQRMADRIAQTLKVSGRLHDYRVSIRYQNGVAELSGSVATGPQRDEALRLARSVPGVRSVRDQLEVREGDAVRLTQAQVPPVPKPFEPPVPSTQELPGTNPLLPEPVPSFRAPQAVASTVAPPKMPPHAWPTYAPYNNYSRVAYPTAYPYNSFPFIGPFYPFPKVPLGWRSVKLEWEDGYWWFSRVGTKYNWWKLRFW